MLGDETSECRYDVTWLSSACTICGAAALTKNTKNCHITDTVPLYMYTI